MSGFLKMTNGGYLTYLGDRIDRLKFLHTLFTEPSPFIVGYVATSSPLKPPFDLITFHLQICIDCCQKTPCYAPVYNMKGLFALT